MALGDVDYRANKAKLEQLIEDADNKVNETNVPGRIEAIEEHHYWIGFSAGLRRALGVIEGRG